jgi:hypothetical protein
MKFKTFISRGNRDAVIKEKECRHDKR